MAAPTLIIIPALNEEEALPAVLESLQTHAPDHDVLVIDDGSIDSTATVARDGGAMVASLPVNLGIGAALRVGFRFAAEHDYQSAVQFDADGQHEARDIHKLLDALDSGAQFVVGTRFGRDGDYSVSRTRGLAMGILRVVVRWVTRTKLSDTSSGFRGFSRPVIQLFARNYPREYMDSVEALIIVSRAGFRIKEVQVRMHERTGGVASNRSFKLAYNYVRLLTGIALTARRAPRQREVL